MFIKESLNLEFFILGPKGNERNSQINMSSFSLTFPIKKNLESEISTVRSLFSLCCKTRKRDPTVGGRSCSSSHLLFLTAETVTTRSRAVWSYVQRVYKKKESPTVLIYVLFISPFFFNLKIYSIFFILQEKLHKWSLS